MNILVTGGCGFIGFHLSEKLLKLGHRVYVIDNMNQYYSIKLKDARLKILSQYEKFVFCNVSIESDSVKDIFENERFDIVINLAAQAGVRYSIDHPDVYIKSNIDGFFNILENCRNYGVERLIYASSSSVYGNNDVPFKESDKVDNPKSLYAATKKSNELMASCYSDLYGFQCTGLRFFTVYGPWGRPDMAPMLFAKSIDSGDTIKVFNNGDLYRDFTYVDDIVDGIIRVVNKKIEYKHRIYNIGCSDPVNLMDFISEIEKNLGKEAKKEFLPMQQGDVYKTYADCSLLENDYGYKPSIKLNVGINKFINWFKQNKDLI